MALEVFKTFGRRSAPSAGSIPVRLRHFLLGRVLAMAYPLATDVAAGYSQAMYIDHGRHRRVRLARRDGA